MGVLSATAAVLLSRIYAVAFSLLRLLKVRKQLTDEEVISLAIAGGTLLLGLKDAAVWGLSLPWPPGRRPTLVAAYTGGVGAGASTGVALGVLLAMGGESSALALFGLCGVTAGCMRRLGRWARPPAACSPAPPRPLPPGQTFWPWATACSPARSFWRCRRGF